MRRRRWALTAIGGALAVGALAVAGDAHAADAPARLPVWLVYDHASSEECPSAERFASALVARSDAITLASAPGEYRTVSIVITAQPGERGRVWTGLFELTEPGGEARQRSIEGTSCEEVAEALNVFTALALDPDARRGPSDPAPRPDAGERAPRRRPRIAKPAVTPPPPPSPEPALAFEVGVGPAALLGYARRLTPGMFVTAGLERTATEPPSRGVDLALHLRLSAGVRASVGSTPDLSARLTTVSLRASPCPVRIAISSAIDGFACADAEVGYVSARSVGSRLSEEHGMVAVGGSAHVRAWLARNVSLEASLGALVPHPRFAFFVDGKNLFTQASLLGEAGLSTTFRL